MLQREIQRDLSAMFSDNRFQRHGRYRYSATIDGEKIGVVLATKSQGYNNFALNKADLDRVVTATGDGRLDAGFVVAATVNGDSMNFIDQISADVLADPLRGEQPRTGKFGEFYLIPERIAFPADEPF
ncbi:hypothetical protein ACFKHW_38075 [Bradyrhizobium lupini]|uniref:hypothetical protein n=1 Tax=Rhizobium lupini TaxID=136996 RepID=UPI00366D8953